MPAFDTGVWTGKIVRKYWIARMQKDTGETDGNVLALMYELADAEGGYASLTDKEFKAMAIRHQAAVRELVELLNNPEE